MLDLSRHQKQKILIVDSNIQDVTTTNGRILSELVSSLQDNNFTVITAATFEDGMATVVSDACLCCVFVDWTSQSDDDASHHQAFALLKEIRHSNKDLPVLLMAERPCMETINLDTMQLVNEFVWMYEDTAEFIASRARALIRRYYEQLLPPFTRALFQSAAEHPEYSWAAPGHQGGMAFTKSAVGREFLDFFGENLFRTDMGIERASLGSLLDHSGAINESEVYAAKIFGAELSYSVLNGTSGSNRTIMQAVIGDNDIALCDRNCHKSVEQGLVMTGAIPLYFMPTRNRYGIIGPIAREQFAPENIAQMLKNHPLQHNFKDAKPVYAVITNCTYDGMCYHAEEVEKLLGQTVDQIHFDEAWYAYARFNPLYKGRYAMRGDLKDFDRKGPTIFATHSTHKLLAALSQSSWIHVRNGRKAIQPSRFNESYMLQATTSPLYALISSNEIGAAMMADGKGQVLTQDVINEAVDFRLALAKANHEFRSKGEWFFSPWNAPVVKTPEGKEIPFVQASREQLASDPACWILAPGANWHGFDELVPDWCLLDPIKVGILCPGMGDDGALQTSGIPAVILTAYLGEKGIIPSRTTDFMVLCLFTLGITKGKWGTLLNVLLEFKRDYDNNTSLKECLPSIINSYASRYTGLGLQDLCREMFNNMQISQMDQLLAAAFHKLPTFVVKPRVAFQQHMAGDSEQLPIEKLSGRTAAVGVIPYPPGIPIIMPGENFGNDKEPWLQYIKSISAWGKSFPGFEKILEGADLIDGKYYIWVLKS